MSIFDHKIFRRVTEFYLDGAHALDEVDRGEALETYGDSFGYLIDSKSDKWTEYHLDDFFSMSLVGIVRVSKNLQDCFKEALKDNLKVLGYESLEDASEGDLSGDILEALEKLHEWSRKEIIGSMGLFNDGGVVIALDDDQESGILVYV